MAETNILWHYTFVPHLESILRDGFIKPATALVEPPERPIVWFSRNQFWERTVTKSIKFSDGRWIELDFKGMVKNGVFPVRIGVLPETAPYDWLALRTISHMKPEMADGLFRVAHQVGADTQDWFGTFTPVAMKEWVDLRFFKSDVWVTPPCVVGAFGVVSLRPSHPHYVGEKA
jgi:hypothetical protein